MHRSLILHLCATDLPEAGRTARRDCAADKPQTYFSA